MSGARFRVALEPLAAPDGLPCGPPAPRPRVPVLGERRSRARPLRRVASGGELSRVFLALKGCCAGGSGTADLRRGGRGDQRGGRSRGRRPSRARRDHQVLCIAPAPGHGAPACTSWCARTLRGPSPWRVEGRLRSRRSPGWREDRRRSHPERPGSPARARAPA
jgi:hypothetical protein